MTAPLIVSIPHRLGRAEATRRVKSGLDTVRSKLTQVMTIEEETWTDSVLQFRVRALGQPASGTIDIAEDHARLEVRPAVAPGADRREGSAGDPEPGHRHAGEEVAGCAGRAPPS